MRNLRKNHITSKYGHIIVLNIVVIIFVTFSSWFSFSPLKELAKFTITVEDAKHLISTITQCIATIVAIVITIPIAITQLSSQVYSPRLHKIVMKNKSFQFSFAVFVSSLMYNIILLYFIPMISGIFLQILTMISIVTVFVCILLTPFYIKKFIDLTSPISIIKELKKSVQIPKARPFKLPEEAIAITDIVRKSIREGDTFTSTEGIKALKEMNIILCNLSDEYKDIIGDFCRLYDNIFEVILERKDYTSAMELSSTILHMLEYLMSTVNCKKEEHKEVVHAIYRTIDFEILELLGRISLELTKRQQCSIIKIITKRCFELFKKDIDRRIKFYDARVEYFTGLFILFRDIAIEAVKDANTIIFRYAMDAYTSLSLHLVDEKLPPFIYEEIFGFTLLPIIRHMEMSNDPKVSPMSTDLVKSMMKIAIRMKRQDLDVPLLKEYLVYIVTQSSLLSPNLPWYPEYDIRNAMISEIYGYLFQTTNDEEALLVVDILKEICLKAVEKGLFTVVLKGIEMLKYVGGHAVIASPKEPNIGIHTLQGVINGFKELYKKSMESLEASDIERIRRAIIDALTYFSKQPNVAEEALNMITKCKNFILKSR
ncbi:MAG: DUF2254 family protein [Candidatus Baldrarchaeia archaeon]